MSKKVINHPNNAVQETIDGFVMANKHSYKKLENHTGIVYKNLKNKVGVLVGGGSGHEPLFLGLIGEGLADGVALGNLFAAPTPDTITEVAKTIHAGQGVIFVYGNYSGDVLNFDMAAELLEMEGMKVETVRVSDDIASAPAERKEERRGIAGDMFVIKIAGAAAEQRMALEEVVRVTRKANDNTFSMGVALSPGTIPGETEPNFTLDEDEIELGLGIHGEPGVEKKKMMPADELVDIMMERILDESTITKGSEVCVLINGLGSTTLMELLIVNRRVGEILEEKEITIYAMDANSYCTTQEMAGFSITLFQLDDELKALYDVPAIAPYYKKL
ncbi:dihydroxyacetone kinase subunit DhaK [Oceanobacillus sp. CFH 90083]|uniref:dihydroxyacetone kinase subunit DhaK n=1 Tax=Oceanobacillus sp. CFH 90083 TaxID=2592336 RepID=UPI00128D4904|nr:dihydroxyacetone kinase subunit DhaK [Oceanobacillus sp. CFH 90083]